MPFRNKLATSLAFWLARDGYNSLRNMVYRYGSSRRRLAGRKRVGYRRTRSRYGRSRYGRSRRSRYRSRMYRKRKRSQFSPTMIASPVGLGNAKTHEVTLTSTIGNNLVPYYQLEGRQGFSENLTAIPFSTVNAINARERNIVNVRGFKIQLIFLALRRDPVMINWAVLHPKELTSTSQFESADFFRAYGSTFRSENFVQTFGDTSGIEGLTPIVHALSPINTDKWIVLKHKRFRLSPASQDNTGTNYTSAFNPDLGPSACKVINRYVRVGRQYRYDNSAALNSQDGSTILLVWCTLLNNDGNTADSSDYVHVSGRVITHFRDTGTY